MKKLSFILTMAIIAFFASCAKDDAAIIDHNILPETFSVDIPQSLSRASVKSMKNGDEILNGDEIYKHLTTFIHVGDKAAEIVEAVIRAIRLFGLSEPGSFTYKSDDDGRAKNVLITADSQYEETIWNYQLTVTDADSEGNDDGGVGLQIFWNTGTIKGIAIMKPYNIDRHTEDLFVHAMFRIDYSEAGENDYEQEMTVYISGLTLPDSLTYPFAMETMKMTAGKNSNVVEVFGNSNHPNAVLLSPDNVGFNWAFVAAGELDTDIGVAEVGLPPSDLNSDNREEILGRYSLKNVFTDEINYAYPGIDPDSLATYLQNTDPPGYFNAQGFVSGGTSPGSEYDAIDAAIEYLVPFNPYEVSNLRLEFKANVSL